MNDEQSSPQAEDDIDDPGAKRLDKSADDVSVGHDRKMSRNTGIIWLAALAITTGAIAAFFSESNKREVEQNAHHETQVRLQSSDGEVERLEAELAALQKDNAELEAEAAAAAEALRAQKATQTELEERLQAEIEKGDVLISNIDGKLVVDLLDKVVFDSGVAELNDRGKAVLKEVGETLAKVPDKVISVAGHTDDLRPSDKIIAQFPSNWELSTKRATNVVRFLQDEVGLPGSKLAVAGYAEHRPIASNRSSFGRRRNRRIEVRLLPLPKKR